MDYSISQMKVELLRLCNDVAGGVVKEDWIGGYSGQIKKRRIAKLLRKIVLDSPHKMSAKVTITCARQGNF